MKIKIIKCSNPNFWYKDKIGNIYEANGNFEYGKLVICSEDTEYLILPGDYKIVSDVELHNEARQWCLELDKQVKELQATTQQLEQQINKFKELQTKTTYAYGPFDITINFPGFLNSLESAKKFAEEISEGITKGGE